MENINKKHTKKEGGQTPVFAPPSSPSHFSPPSPPTVHGLAGSIRILDSRFRGNDREGSGNDREGRGNDKKGIGDDRKGKGDDKKRGEDDSKERRDNNLMKIINKERGQTMMLMVILIAAVSLSAIVFTSFVVVAELRRVTDARLSGAALFAADTGIECVLFYEFGHAPYGLGCPPICQGAGCFTSWAQIGSGGSSPSFQLQFVSSTIANARQITIWRAIGRDASGRAVRSLEITLQQLI